MLNNEMPPELAKKVAAYCERLDNKILQDHADLYVKTLGHTASDKSTNFDLAKAIESRLLESKECQVIIVFGDAGAGKSFFLQHFVLGKAREFPKSGYIPIYMPLPLIKEPKESLMEEVLLQKGLIQKGYTKEEIEALKKHCFFLLCVDGPEEMKDGVIKFNFIKSNNLHEWNVKIVIACRTFIKSDSNYKALFLPHCAGRNANKLLQELHIPSFSQDQIDLYVKQYLKVFSGDIAENMSEQPEVTSKWLNPEHYLRTIKEVPKLNQLAPTPFFLKIIMQEAPAIWDEYQEMKANLKELSISYLKLFKRFIEGNFQREAGKNVDNGDHWPNMEKHYWNYAKDFASLMIKKGISVVEYLPEDVDSEWARFLCFDRMIPSDKGDSRLMKRRFLCFRACLLVYSGDNNYRFANDLVMYYLHSEQMRPEPIPNQTLVSQLSDKRSPVQSSFGRKIIYVDETKRSYEIIKRLTAEEAKKLLEEEGIRLKPFPEKAIIGSGNFGTLFPVRVGERFGGVKKIKEKNIQSCETEAEIQKKAKELSLSHVMPLWDSVKKFNALGKPVLYQFMPLAFLNGYGFQVRWHCLPGSIDGCEDLSCEPSIKYKELRNVSWGFLTGIQQLHSYDISHGDIKKTNFVMDKRGKVYIIDFGCAIREVSLTDESTIRVVQGDINYYSPERLRNHQTLMQRRLPPPFDTKKADCWAAGVTLLEMLIGRHPFGKIDPKEWKREDFEKCLRKIPGFENPPAGSLMELIKRLLDFDPAKRPSIGDALKHPFFKRKDLCFATEEDRQKSLILLCEEYEKQVAQLNEESSSYSSSDFSDQSAFDGSVGCYESQPPLLNDSTPIINYYYSNQEQIRGIEEKTTEKEKEKEHRNEEIEKREKGKEKEHRKKYTKEQKEEIPEDAFTLVRKALGRPPESDSDTTEKNEQGLKFLSFLNETTFSSENVKSTQLQLSPEKEKEHTRESAGAIPGEIFQEQNANYPELNLDKIEKESPLGAEKIKGEKQEHIKDSAGAIPEEIFQEQDANYPELEPDNKVEENKKNPRKNPPVVSTAVPKKTSGQTTLPHKWPTKDSLSSSGEVKVINPILQLSKERRTLTQAPAVTQLPTEESSSQKTRSSFFWPGKGEKKEKKEKKIKKEKGKEKVETKEKEETSNTPGLGKRI